MTNPKTTNSVILNAKFSYLVTHLQSLFKEQQLYDNYKD